MGEGIGFTADELAELTRQIDVETWSVQVQEATASGLRTGATVEANWNNLGNWSVPYDHPTHTRILMHARQVPCTCHTTA